MANDLIKLNDLNVLRSAPSLNDKETQTLLIELQTIIYNYDWFTVGVMASNSKIALSVIRDVEKYFDWEKMQLINLPYEDGPVYLKANQSSGEIQIRIEYGLGEGILLCCHKKDISQDSKTLGPFPLNFFEIALDSKNS